MLHKLKAYGVVGPILSILESFLQECSLKVVLEAQSTPLLYHQCWSSSGIGFGGNLIPGFYYDVLNDVLSRIGIYADDTTLYSSLGKAGFC